jgi:hypothetical protein
MVKAKLHFGVVVLIMVALMFGACSDIVGGPCEYVDIPGIARVVSANEADPADFNCKNAVEVIFDFIPDDPAAIDDYLFPTSKDTGKRLTVGSGMNPPKTWVLEQGLTEGSEHSCIRREITKGTCTPVIFHFPDIDMNKWEETCFEE